jgi:hypothetical protein
MAFEADGLRCHIELPLPDRAAKQHERRDAAK